MKKTVIVVMVLYFIQSFIQNIGHPITPDLVVDLGINNYMFGVFFALMSLGLALGGPIWGILGDRYNKKTIIVIGVIIYAVSQYIFGNVHNVVVMSIFRFIGGFGVSASLTLMMSYLIEKSDESRKKRNIAIASAVIALSASIGYYFGGAIFDWMPSGTFIVSNEYSLNVIQAEWIFLVQSLMLLVLAVLIYVFMGDSEVSEETQSNSMIQNIKSIRTLNPNLLVFLLSLTLVSIATINISKYLEVYIGTDLGYGARGIGDFVAATGIVGMLTMIFIVPQIVKLRKDMTIMLITNILSSVIIILVFRMENIMTGLYTLFMLYMVMKSIYTPLETSYISSFAKQGEIGKIMGVRQFFFAIGLVIGPLMAGFIYDYNPLMVFDVSAILFMIGFILIFIVSRNLNREAHVETSEN